MSDCRGPRGAAAAQAGGLSGRARTRPGSYEVSLVRDGLNTCPGAVETAPRCAGTAPSSRRGHRRAAADGRRRGQPPGRARSSASTRAGHHATTPAGAEDFCSRRRRVPARPRLRSACRERRWSDGDDGRTRPGYALLFARYHIRCDSSSWHVVAAAVGPAPSAAATPSSCSNRSSAYRSRRASCLRRRPRLSAFRRADRETAPCAASRRPHHQMWF